MADQVGAYFDNGHPAWWIEASTGKPYQLLNGKKSYLPPRAVNGYAPSGAPSGGLFHGQGEWNPETGQFDQHLAGGNILALATAAGLGAPWLAGALGAGGAAAPALSAPASVLPAASPELLGGAAASSVGALGVPASLAAPVAAETGGMSGELGTIGVPASLSNAGLAPVAASSPSWMSGLIKAAVPGALAAQHFLGGGTPSIGATTALPPEMQAILSEFARRVTNQGPLADATTAQALAGLPRLR